MKRMFGAWCGILIGLALFFSPHSGLAIDITISPTATAEVGLSNTVTISPVKLSTPLPGFPVGNYIVLFQWDPNSSTLVPIAATRISGGGNPTGGAVGQVINGVLIEAEVFGPRSISLPGCALYVSIRNQTAQVKFTGLYYNGFDATGRGVGWVFVSTLLSANSSTTLEGLWIASGNSGTLACSQIARYELDPAASM